MERAWLRRIEFRRRAKKHQRKLDKKQTQNNFFADLMKKGKEMKSEKDKKRNNLLDNDDNDEFMDVKKEGGQKMNSKV